MKRIVALVLAVLMLAGMTAFAEGMDVTHLTDEELNSLEQAIAKEREARASAASEQPAFEAIQRGDYNENNKALQQQLKDLGYLAGKVDGIFGPQTEGALKDLQAVLGWEQTGVVESEYQWNVIKGLSISDGVNLLAEPDYYIEKNNTSESVDVKAIMVKEDVDLQSLIGKALTLSVLVNAPGERGTSVTDEPEYLKDRFGCHASIAWGDSTGALEDTTTYPATELLYQSVENKRISSTFVVTPPEGYDTIKSFAVAMQAGAKPAADNEATWFLGNPMLEIGIATED